MSESNFALPSEADDLPRTLRREREARDRETREREAREREAREKAERDRVANETYGRPEPIYRPEPAYAPDPVRHEVVIGGPDGVTVNRLDIPFAHLVFFFLKAVLAAVPALILLIAILWGIGHALQVYFPQLVKMQVLVWFPKG
jgi:hypothetical protein